MRLLIASIFLAAFMASAQSEKAVVKDYDYSIKLQRCSIDSKSLQCRISNFKKMIPTIVGAHKMTTLSITKGPKKTYNIVVNNLDKTHRFGALKLKASDIQKIKGEFEHFKTAKYPFLKSFMKTESTFVRGMYATIVGDKKVANGTIFISIHEDNIDQPISLNFHWLAAKSNSRGQFLTPYIEEEIRFDFTSDI